MSESNPYMMVGERLCMDFINTVSWRESVDKSRDWFTSYAKLIDWSIYAQLLTEEEAKVLHQKAEKNPAAAAQVLEQTFQFREGLYRIFKRISKQQFPSQGDIEQFNTFISQYYQNLQLTQQKDQFRLGFHYTTEDLDMMLPPILQSAVDLLVSRNEWKRVKQCEGDPCGWLFYDTSRNRSRRWCSMADCGNRAKARRFYQKEK
ncbi:CGNR zinc finger domain-containing protein [Pseudalkalibacillus sp. Hm43]|uniref:CGNR zinc finger domain-containing protein n=1 Tax=Pseudalkalibacillus sp. Hm43 TaxID=3450742 RepID=UPI003F42ADC0